MSTDTEMPPHSGLLGICRDLNREVSRNLMEGEATRAALFVGELTERLRQLESDVWCRWNESRKATLDERSEQTQT